MTQNSFFIDIDAPIDRVWETITDHERYAKWSPAQKVTYEKEGNPEKRGLGAIRVFHSGPGGRIRVREEVTGWDPPHSMTYKLLASWPIRNYASTMSLESKSPEQTRLTWESMWEDRLPKWAGSGIVAKNLRRALNKFANGIKEDVENTSHTLINPEDVAPPVANYSLGVVYSNTKQQLVTSGIVPTRKDGSVPRKLDDQCEVIWESIGEILKDSNMDTTDIVSVTTYVVKKEAKNLKEVMGMRDEFMRGHAPASTLIVVPRLANKAWKLEISVIASR